MAKQTSINQFEELIEGILEAQYGFCDDFLELETVIGLRQYLLNARELGLMRPAGVGRKANFQKSEKIRGDVIQWIENDTINEYERTFLNKVQAFILHLNRSCYTSINDFEFHYAYYEVGSFYKRHLDQFKSDGGRKFSLVFYLNDDWIATDGGNIRLYLKDKTEKDLYPNSGKCVFFKSDELEHEVKPSETRYRLSIVGWLKSV
jgi:SM-20-related protein